MALKDFSEDYKIESNELSEFGLGDIIYYKVLIYSKNILISENW